MVTMPRLYALLLCIGTLLRSLEAPNAAHVRLVDNDLHGPSRRRRSESDYVHNNGMEAIHPRHRRFLLDEERVFFYRLDGLACNDPGIEDEIRRARGWLECEELCSKEEDCAAYDYNRGDRKCHLKATPCIDQEREQSGHHVGIRVAQQPDVAAHAAVEFERLDGVGCHGEEIPGGRTKASSREACEGICAYLSDASKFEKPCKAYSYNKYRGRCYLKEDACIDTVAKDSNDSGTVIQSDSTEETETPEETDALQPVAAEVEFERLDGIGCHGGEIPFGDTKTSSREACEAICAYRSHTSALNKPCKAYSYKKSDGRCYLKEDPCIDKEAKDDNDSGIVLSSPAERSTPAELVPYQWTAVEFEHLDGIGCLGDEIPRGRMTTSSRAACEAVCAYKSDASKYEKPCKAYSYRNSTNRCYLKEDPCIYQVPKDSNDSGIVLGGSAEGTATPAPTTPAPTTPTPTPVPATPAPTTPAPTTPAPTTPSPTTPAPTTPAPATPAPTTPSPTTPATTASPGGNDDDGSQEPDDDGSADDEGPEEPDDEGSDDGSQVPPTPAPTTPAPTTPAPTTPSPTTPAPTTPVPTTPAPTTPSPTTPTTPAPTTPSPATPAPTTPSPTTSAPTTPVPTTPAPATPAPTTPTTPAPTTPSPTTPAPTTPSPTTPAPTTPVPTTPAPTTPSPSTPAPTTPSPTTPAPTTPVPTTPAPTTPSPSTPAPTSLIPGDNDDSGSEGPDDDGSDDAGSDGPDDGSDDAGSDGPDDGSVDAGSEGPDDGPDDAGSDGPDDVPDDAGSDGPDDGSDDAGSEGPDDGPDDAGSDGPDDGSDDAGSEGPDDGPDDAVSDGPDDGSDDGSADGPDDGSDEAGSADAPDDGSDDGSADGPDDGSDDAGSDGPDDGSDDGSADGPDDGSDDAGSDDPDGRATDDGADDDAGSDFDYGSDFEYDYSYASDYGAGSEGLDDGSDDVGSD